MPPVIVRAVPPLVPRVKLLPPIDRGWYDATPVLSTPSIEKPKLEGVNLTPLLAPLATKEVIPSLELALSKPVNVEPARSA
jgi:hypothetical protein